MCKYCQIGFLRGTQVQDTFFGQLDNDERSYYFLKYSFQMNLSVRFLR